MRPATALPTRTYARVTGAGADYSLVVTRDADFDTEPNDDVGDQAQDITLTGSAFGALGQQVTAITEETEPNDDGIRRRLPRRPALCQRPVGEFCLRRVAIRTQAVVTGTISAGNDTDWDFFKVLASPGDTLAITLQGAPSGSGTLGDPYLRLFDNTGTQIASNDDFFGPRVVHRVQQLLLCWRLLHCCRFVRQQHRHLHADGRADHDRSHRRDSRRR